MTATGTAATTAATTATTRAAATEAATAVRTADGGFPTVFGRELIGELPNFVHRPYLVVTMADLWPRFEHLFDSHLAGVHLVESLDVVTLETAAAGLPEFGSVIGLGGGQVGLEPFDLVAHRAPVRRTLPALQLRPDDRDRDDHRQQRNEQQQQPAADPERADDDEGDETEAETMGRRRRGDLPEPAARSDLITDRRLQLAMRSRHAAGR